MSDEKNDNLLVSNYIKRHEAVLMEHIRKQIDAEARNTLFEMAVSEQNKIIEDQTNTISSLQDTLEQALNSVKINTMDKESIDKDYHELLNKYNQQNNEIRELITKSDKLTSEVQDLTNKHNLLVEENRKLTNEVQDLRNKAGQHFNSTTQLQEENHKLREQLAAAENNIQQTKNNYNLVLKSLEECEQALPQPKKKQQKKTNTKNDNSEWIDGNEVSD